MFSVSHRPFRQVRGVSVCPIDLLNGWQIISPTRSFSVYAATATEKAEWMAHIDKCVQDLLKKRESPLNPAARDLIRFRDVGGDVFFF